MFGAARLQHGVSDGPAGSRGLSSWTAVRTGRVLAVVSPEGFMSPWMDGLVGGGTSVLEHAVAVMSYSYGTKVRGF